MVSITIDYEKKHKSALNFITEAAINDDLIIFLGSGVSQLIGTPSWEVLADMFIKHLLNNGKISYSYANVLEKDNPRKILTICKDLDEKKGKKFPIRDIIESEKFSKDDDTYIDYKDIYEHLYKIRATFITTNFDSYLDKELYKSKTDDFANNVIASTNPIFHYKDINGVDFDDLLTRGKIIHIHGSLHDPSERSLVLTLYDYIEAYDILPKDKDEKNKSNLPDFLKHVFHKKNKTILFVGYGLNEDFILEHFIAKKNEGLKRFILYPLLNRKHVTFEEKYFNQIGINLIPYNIGQKGHGQLYFELKKLSKLIFDKTATVIDKFTFIDQINK